MQMYKGHVVNINFYEFLVKTKFIIFRFEDNQHDQKNSTTVFVKYTLHAVIYISAIIFVCVAPKILNVFGELHVMFITEL